MKLPHHGSGQSVLAEINITPMVDVMLVLLIIFMVTAPMLHQGIDIDLPEVNASSVAATQEDLVLSIDADGRLFLGSDKDASFSLETIGDKLKAIFENKEKKELYLHADKGVLYGFVVKVMALCQQAGVERVGMITQPDDKEKTKEKK